MPAQAAAAHAAPGRTLDSIPDAVAGFDSSAVRDTVARVFENPIYDESLRETLWTQLWRLFWRSVIGTAKAVGQVPHLRWIVLGLAAAVVAAFLARAVYVSRTPLGAFARHAGSPPRRDPWVLARELADRQDFLGATHALYAAVLESLAHHDRVVLHPSKTSGDYRRDLIARSSPSADRFREFARLYERSVWRARASDAATFSQLRSLAQPFRDRAANIYRSAA